MFRWTLLVFVSLVFSSTAFPMAQDILLLTPPGGYDVPSEKEIEVARTSIDNKFGFYPEHFMYTHRVDYRKYSHLDPKGLVPDALLERALLFFDRYKSSFENQNYISVVDFSMKSNQPRMFVINMRSGKVQAIRTAHGAGGDKDDDGYVEELSNIPNSHMSSKGFYQVSEIYHGRYGRSLRLDGLSTTNSNVRRRAIVIHGFDGVTETYDHQRLSWGCFSLAWSVKDLVVDKIHSGSLLYADRSANY